MDKLSTFLDLPLDRILYKTKPQLLCKKEAIRILVTEGKSPVARLLMYKICSGQVFGPTQPVIIHLSQKGFDQNSIIPELQRCGFPGLEDAVISSKPQVAYKDVDIIVLYAPCEEVQGYCLYNSFLYQLNIVRDVARNMRKHAKPDTKLVLCCPSTKGAILLLTCITKFEPLINQRNITAVINLDEMIAKHMVAAKLKTTSDSIKNITFWGALTADLRNATVRMYPPDDKANLEKVELPVLEVLQNQKWIYTRFLPSIFNRPLGPELVRYGAALATATAKHLKLLIEGSDCSDEIVSMGVIVPPEEPLGFTKDTAFSVPVVIKNGSIVIRQDLEYEVTTHLMNMRALYDVENDIGVQEVNKMVKFILDYEKREKRKFIWSQNVDPPPESPYDLFQYLKYYVTPLEEYHRMTERAITSSMSEIRRRHTVSKKGRSTLRFTNIEDITKHLKEQFADHNPV